MKKIIATILAFVMVLGTVVIGVPEGGLNFNFGLKVFAAREIASGKCGENLTWVLDSDGMLTISGSGEMTNWSDSGEVPWYRNRSDIKAVEITGATSIGERAFEYCTSLTSITIPDSVITIGEIAFYGCSLTTVTIGNSVTTIGDRAFSRCSSLTSITIPDKVTSIGMQAFYFCTLLEAIDVDDNNAAYKDMDGVLFNKSGNILICCPGGKSGAYSIPDGVITIGDHAFCFCGSLVSITIPDSVTSIGNSAFDCCTSLTSVTIPDSVTSIGDRAFSNCDSLTSVTIPDSVTSIGDYAFDDCTSLTGVTIGDSVTSIGYYAFSDCDSLTSVTVPDSVTSIGYGAFYDSTSLTSITIPDSVLSIGNSAFYYCEKLTDVYYTGSETQWKEIRIGSSNAPLLNATRHYNYVMPATADALIEISPKVDRVEVDGSSVIFLAQLLNKDGTLADVQDGIVWSTDSDKIRIEESGSNMISVTGISAGIATIRATAPNGRSDVCTVVIGDAAPILSLDMSSSVSTVRVDNGAYSSDEFKVKVKVGNGMNEGSYGADKRDILTVNSVNVSINLTDGLSFEKSGIATSKTFTIPKLEWGTSHTETITVYVRNAGTGTKTITGEIEYSGIKDSEKCSVAFTGSGDSEEVKSTEEIKPKVETQVISSFLDHQGDLKIGRNNVVSVKAILRVQGNIIVEDGGELIVNASGSVVADSVTVGDEGKIDVCGGNLETSSSGANYIKIGGGSAFGDTSGGQLQVGRGLNPSSLKYNYGVVKTGTLTIEKEGELHQDGGNIVATKRFYSNCNSRNTLTAGNLWIGGDFRQSNNNDNFRCTDGHSTIIYGAGEHEVKFDLWAKESSYFNNVYVDKNADMFSVDFKDMEEYVNGEFAYATDVDLQKYKYKVGDSLFGQKSWEVGITETLNDAANYTDAIVIIDNDFVTYVSDKGNIAVDTKEVAAFKEALLIYLVSIESGAKLSDKIQECVENVDKDIEMTIKTAKKGTKTIHLRIDGFNSIGTKSYNIHWSADGVEERMLGSFYSAKVNEFCDSVKDYIKEECKNNIVKAASGVFTFFSGMDIEEAFGKFISEKITEITKSIVGIAFDELYETDKSKKVLTAAESDSANYMMLSSSGHNEPLMLPAGAVNKAAPVGTGKALSEDLISAIKAETGIDAATEAGLAMLKKLTVLDLSNGFISDVSGIDQLESLKELDLSNNSVSDCSPISGLKKLESLNISSNKISDISSLSSLSALESLRMANNMVSVISGVSTMTELSVLDASNNRITSLSALSALAKMRYLDISGNPLGAGGLNALSSMKGLTTFNASGCGLTGIGGLPVSSVISLDLSDNNVTSLNALSGADKLERLALSNNQIGNEGFAAVCKLRMMTELHVDGAGITSLEGIAALSALESLDISRNTLQQGYDEIAKLPVLEKLKASAVGMDDAAFAEISKSASLSELDVSSNGIRDLNSAQLMNRLKKLDISYNPAIMEDAEASVAPLVSKGVDVLAENRSIAVSDVIMLDRTATVKVGSEIELYALAYPQAANERTIVWSSSDNSIAAVDEDGTVTAYKEGICTITASTEDGGHKDTCEVTVTASTRLPGDINSDGEVNLLDSTVLRRHLAGWSNATINASNADVNADGKVDMKDSTILRRYLAGWEGVELK